jgi:uncharacterized membrane protein YbhN (UPF0104 family)
MSRIKWRRVLWGSLQALLVCVVLYFLVRTLAVRWSQVMAFPWRFRIVPLAGSLALQLIAALFWATIWRHMVVRLGYPVRWADGVRIYLVSNLAKYVPGSIWGYMSRAYLGWGEGLTVMGVGLSVVWEVGITVVSSLLLTVATIPTYPGKLPDAFLQLVLAVAGLCLIGLLPPVFNRWVRVFKRWQPARNYPSFQWQDFFLFLVAAFVTHVLVGLGFFMFTYSFVDIDPHYWWSLVGLWSFSATAGLLIVLAPYGLGVKEGLLTLLLRPLMPIESAVVISIASRIWVIVGELVAAMLAIILFQTSRKNQVK